MKLHDVEQGERFFVTANIRFGNGSYANHLGEWRQYLFCTAYENHRISRKNVEKNTVLTFLVRLIDKGYLSATKTGRAKEYFATVTENEYQEEQAKIFLDKVYSGNVKGLVSALLKQDSLTKEDFRELHDFWKKGEDAK